MDELQLQILRSMLTKQGWELYSDFVGEDVLTNTEVRAVYAEMARLHETATSDLTPEALAIAVQSSYANSGDRLDELLDVVEAIDETKEVDPNALQDSVRRFVSRELLAQAARYVATNLASPSLDPDVAYALCQKAVDVHKGATGCVVDFASADLPGSGVIRSGVTALGFSRQLDDCLDGGIGAGELAVFLAPPARGKTSILCHAGATAAKAGKGVLHITLEISARRVVRRYDQALTGLKSSELIASPLLVGAARKAMREAGGEVHIKDWSYADVTPNDVRGLVKRLRHEGKKVDMVVIDYLELMQPSNTDQRARREQRHIYSLLGKQMRAVAVACEVPILTAWQVNREGSDQHNVELRHVSESWDVIKHADAIIALNQTEAERDERIMRMRILKQRESTERPQVYLHADLNRMVIRDAQGDTDGATTSLDAG